jgi:hypothetical protein
LENQIIRKSLRASKINCGKQAENRNDFLLVLKLKMMIEI